MSRRTVAGCLLALLLLLPVAGRAEWNPWHPDPIIEYHYNYDNVGNIKSIEDSVKNSTGTFIYDEVDRLKQAIGNYGVNGATETVNYSYNAVGDITGTPSFPTDGNGNITQLNGKTIEYDYENRPYKITDTTGTITEFKYDYAGQRVLKKVTVNGATAKTYYVGNIYEVNYSTTGVETQTIHIYAGALRVASRITKNGGSNTYYYIGDHLGSTRMMTDALGQTVQDVTYEPWGNTVTESVTTYKADHKFTGQMLDDSTGLYYYGARYYDPGLRRFINPDPKLLEIDLKTKYLLEPKNLNCYAYCWNNPLRFVDPDGEEPKKPQYIYRVDDPAKMPEVKGFQPTSKGDPNVRLTVAEHIGKEMKPSQWISATTDPNNTNYQGTRYRIDVAELEANGGKVLTTKQLLGYARNDPASIEKINVDSEVLIKGNIPASAITKLGQVLGKMGTVLSVVGVVNTAIRATQALEKINNAPEGSVIYINPLSLDVTIVSKPEL